MTKLRLIKFIHTLVWVVMAAAVFEVLWESISGYFTPMLPFSLALIVVEILILVLNRGECPLRFIAARHTEDRHDGFDIYIPGWLVRHNIAIFGTLFTLGVILILLRTLLLN